MENLSTMCSRVTPWRILMLLLCLYVLFALVIEMIITLSPNTTSILSKIDYAVCVIFLVDFVRQFSKAQAKLRYLGTWGWIDLLSSLPNMQMFRWGRIARVFRIMRSVKSLRVIYTCLCEDMAKGYIVIVGMVCFLLIVFSSIAMLHLETTPQANIKTADDALWWAVSTMTTVGYGDCYPVTRGGRILAIILMITGVNMFAALTNYAVSLCLESKFKQEKDKEDRVLQEIESLKEKLSKFGNG